MWKFVAALVATLALLVVPAVSTAGVSRLTVAENIAASVFPPLYPFAVQAGYAYGWDGWADPAAATVTIEPRVLRMSRAYLCSLLVHEYGHMAGLPHSDDPNSIMNPAVRITYPACAWLSDAEYQLWNTRNKLWWDTHSRIHSNVLSAKIRRETRAVESILNRIGE